MRIYLVAGLVLAGTALLPARAAHAECSQANNYAYFKLEAPKALVTAKDGCFAFSASKSTLKDVINAALARCEGSGDRPCRLVDFDGVAPALPRPPEPAVAAVQPQPEMKVAVPPPPRCPGGERVPVSLAGEPVRVNPDGFCGLTVWYRHCIYLRQAGEEKQLGPYCPPEAKMLPGAVRAKQFPPDVEWIWSAEEPFTAFVVLVPADAAPGPAAEAGLAMGSPVWKERCGRKYKTFDWNTGLYVAKDGSKKECTLP